ncbi:MAG: helix-turn-helix domain-containing protein [Candidatus Thermoplasmatota archaeon]|nr:helix-turn-helix domain-containing protein [Candidatus Thermoplasmatota archaeon]
MGRDAEEIQFIERLLKQEKNPNVRDRLRGILLLKKNYKPGEVAEILGVTERTLYNWKKQYKQSGYNGLKTKPIPGRNTILDEEDMKKLKELLQMRDYWASKEVRELIKNEFDIVFTPRHIPRILRKLGMTYQKPYVNDYRRPEDAEDILKKT